MTVAGLPPILAHGEGRPFTPFEREGGRDAGADAPVLRPGTGPWDHPDYLGILHLRKGC